MQPAEPNPRDQAATVEYVDTKLQEIRDLLKERETNRVRAVATLISEINTYITHGTPVSASAIKGFAFAMLAPRLLLIAGSVVGALVLVFQTVLIWQQNRLLDRQTAIVEATHYTLIDISSNFGKEGIIFSVRNIGTAIAQIESIECKFNGKTVTSKTLSEIKGVGYTMIGCDSDTLPPAQTDKIIEIMLKNNLSEDEERQVWKDLDAALKTIEITATYRGPLDHKPLVRTYSSYPKN